MVAEASKFPIDLLKTQSTMSVCPSEIIREDGVLGLYQGLSPAIIRPIFYTPVRIVCYGYLINRFVPSDHSLSLSTKAIIVGTSGVVAQMVASPADLIKVRMQVNICMVKQGLKPRCSGPLNALKTIICTEGFGRLLKGFFLSVQIAFLVNMGELAFYAHAKRLILQNLIAYNNICVHTLSSIMSGLSATALVVQHM